MDLRRLRYFVAVAEELNFTRAAERLHMAQPPLSMQIRALEEDIGAALFVRDKRRVYLAPAGHQLLDRARAILAAAEEARAAARSAAEGRIGRVALGYTASAMFTERLPAALRQFRARHGTVELDLREMTSADQLHALHGRELDVGVLRKTDAGPPSGVVIEPWYRSPLVAALPRDHALARRRGIGIAELRDEALITYPRDAGIGLYWPVMRLCAQAGVAPRVVREAREPSVMIGLVAAGAGIAIVPFDTQCIHLEGVTYQRLRDAEAFSTLYLAFRREAARGTGESLLAALRLAADAPMAPARPPARASPSRKRRAPTLGKRFVPAAGAKRRPISR